MHGIRFVIGRPRGSNTTAIQSIVFDAREWTERDARSWLDRQGFKPRDLDKAGGQLRYRLREPTDFEPRSFRTIDTGRREKVTMASNPKRARKKRRSRKASKSTKRRRVKRTAPQTVRTVVKSVKVMRKNPKRKKPGAPKRRAVGARYTIAFAPAAARVFAKVARLSAQRRHAMRKALQRHPGGGVYVALPDWHGTREQARRLAERVHLVLAYAAGRRRASAASLASAPRVVTVP